MEVWGVYASGRPRGKSEYDLEFDTRPFRNGAHEWDLRGHWGVHDKNVGLLYEDHYFRSLVDRAARRLATYVPHAPAKLWSLFCSKGKHRSVRTLPKKRVYGLHGQHTGHWDHSGSVGLYRGWDMNASN